jgi:hypothetical protein
MNYSHLLLPAPALTDPVSRLQQVATFAVSALAGNENRLFDILHAYLRLLRLQLACGRSGIVTCEQGSIYPPPSFQKKNIFPFLKRQYLPLTVLVCLYFTILPF